MHKYLLFVFIIISCTPDDWKTSADLLLFNTRWIGYYTDNQGRSLDHYLKFETWGEGRETIMNGAEELENNFFTWYWEMDGYSMRLEYENGKVTFLDRMQIISSRLHARLDDIDIIFVPF